MTVHDTTYFISEPRQTYHQVDGKQWHNTFKFLHNTTYKKYKTYNQEEIKNQLEKSTPIKNERKS